MDFGFGFDVWFGGVMLFWFAIFAWFADLRWCEVGFAVLSSDCDLVCSLVFCILLLVCFALVGAGLFFSLYSVLS